MFIDKTGDTLDKSPTALDAFLHFTYHESGRKFLLCGFQVTFNDRFYFVCLHVFIAVLLLFFFVVFFFCFFFFLFFGKRGGGGAA